MKRDLRYLLGVQSFPVRSAGEATRSRSPGLRAIGLVALLLVSIPAGSAAESSVPSISLGEGRSLVVEYDLNFEPLRRYTGLTKPVDITPLPDGAILLVDEGTREVLLFERDGTVRWRDTIGRYPLRARPRFGGGLLVTTPNEAVATREDRSVEWTLPLSNLRTAVPLINGNILTARNEGQGWLSEWTPEGKQLWRSKPRGQKDSSGNWVEEDPTEYFLSMSGLDAGADGTILVTDYDRHDFRLLSADYHLQRRFSPLHHITDVRLGPRGELVAVSPEDFRVWIANPDGSSRSFQPPMKPYCANLSPSGTLLVGMVWEPARAMLNATNSRAARKEPLPWWRRPLPVPATAFVMALLLAIVVRWPGIRHRRRVSITPDSQTAEPPGDQPNQLPYSTEPRPTGVSASRGHRLLMAFLFLTSALGAWVAWEAAGQIPTQGLAATFPTFAIGCAVSGIALRVANRFADASKTLTTFIPRASERKRHTERWRTSVLLLASALSLGGCMYVVISSKDWQALAIALWLAAQVWIVAAALPLVRRLSPDSTTSQRKVHVVLTGVLLLATATRFWEIGYYPDHVHHDHALYGHALLRTLSGDWQPFFIMEPYTASTFARPWLIPAMGTFELFGRHYWVLRLTGALSGVLLTWAIYLLGTALLNRRVGLIAAFLATINHSLLLYSRQPYVIESTAPFLLALFFAIRGMQLGCRFRWCLSGLLGGWSMLSIRQCTTFPFIGAVILAYLLFAHRKWLWENRFGILWMAAAAVVVYLPIVPHMLASSELTTRLTEVGVLFAPDGSIRWDADLWASQLKRSFGAIVYYKDTNPWGVSLAKPICLRIDSCLFGIGLTYLLLSWRGPATAILLAGITVSIFLGSAMVSSPPTYYHFFVAIALVMVVCAVAADRVLAVTDTWRSWHWRAVPRIGIALILGLAGMSHLEAAWGGVRRQQTLKNEGTVFRTDFGVVAARFIREHPDYRFYLIRLRSDVSCTSPVFRFFAADSDVSDLTGDLGNALPVDTGESTADLYFLVAPSRTADRSLIESSYPDARAQELKSNSGTGWAYRVDAELARGAYQRHRELAGHRPTSRPD